MAAPPGAAIAASRPTTGPAAVRGRGDVHRRLPLDRGRQLLHDAFQPPLNRINPISPNNQNRDRYLEEAERFLERLRSSE
jgi:hypothetical protein